MFTQASSERQLLHRIRFIHLVVCAVMGILVLGVLIGLVILGEVRMMDHSMENGLKQNQVLFYLKSPWYYHPTDGDIVLIQTSEPHIESTKRIVGVPGEKIKENGIPVLLLNNVYFVEGDNGDKSIDSRNFGAINRDQILGKILNAPSAPITFP